MAADWNRYCSLPPSARRSRRHILRDLFNELLEGDLSDEEFSAFLVPADLTKGHSARSVAMRLFWFAGIGLGPWAFFCYAHAIDFCSFLSL